MAQKQNFLSPDRRLAEKHWGVLTVLGVEMAVPNVLCISVFTRYLY